MPTFDGLIKASVAILSDSFGLTYANDYGISQITFSPTVYEMLKRYEFTRKKYENESKNSSNSAEMFKYLNKDFQFNQPMLESL